MRVLVTGGCGFIGSNLVRWLLDQRRDPWRDVRVVNLDALTYAGNLANLKGVESDGRYRFVRGDITDAALVGELLAAEAIDAVVNTAAETHVDRSLLGPRAFISANVLGTLTLLEAARVKGGVRFVQVSTDEVYGSLLPDDPPATEANRLLPSSPYSASKAAADHLVHAYHVTYGLKAMVTRCSNNYGPYQFPEKLIPLMTLNALTGTPLPVYGDGLNVRDWIHVTDHCTAIARVLEAGRPGRIYNVGAGNQQTNLTIVRRLLALCGQPESLVTFVADRPGHDRRYALDASRIERELGFRPEARFDEALAATVDWYRKNETWWRSILDGTYRDSWGRPP